MAPCTQCKPQYTPLGYAVVLDNAAVVNLLLSFGADSAKSFKVSGKDYTPLEFAKVFNKNNALAALEQFSKRPAALPKMVPITNDSEELVRLQREKCQLQVQLDEMMHCLGAAELQLENKDGEIESLRALMDVLLEKLAALNKQSKAVAEALKGRICEFENEVKEDLQTHDQKADINALSDEGQRPLLLACNSGKVDVAELLVLKGGELSLPDIDTTAQSIMRLVGNSPVHRCQLVQETQLLRSKCITMHSEYQLVHTKCEELCKDEQQFSLVASFDQLHTKHEALMELQRDFDDLDARESLRAEILALSQSLVDQCCQALHRDNVTLGEVLEALSMIAAVDEALPSTMSEEQAYELILSAQQHTTEAMRRAHVAKKLQLELEQEALAGAQGSGGTTLSKIALACQSAEAIFCKSLATEKSSLLAYVSACGTAQSILLHQLRQSRDSFQTRVFQMHNWLDEVMEKSRALALIVDAGSRRFEALALVESTGKALREAKSDLKQAKKISKKLTQSERSTHTSTVNCLECESAIASILCFDCREVFCMACFKARHISKARANHRQKALGESFEEAVTRTRKAFEEALKALHEIRVMGYPELKYPGVERLPLSITVPKIAVEELEALERVVDAPVIGEGAFAKVHRLEIPHAGAVAFKRFKFGINVELMQQEANAIFRLRHPNVVHLYGICVAPDLTGLVLELVDGGSLADHIYRNPPLPFEKEKSLSVLHSMCVGLQFIHSQQHLHLDIKASNVLVSADFKTVKLSDFGAAQELRETLAFLTRAPELTLRWAAPERLQGATKLTPAADVWSVGMVLFEMCVAEAPYKSVDDLKIISLVLNEKQIPSIPSFVDPCCAALMKSCWAYDPERRISVDSLLKTIADEQNRTCIVCLQGFVISRGAECDSLEKKHPVCCDCLVEGMTRLLDSGNLKAVPHEGYCPCLNQNCCGIIGHARLQTLVPSSLLVSWTSACASAKLEQTKMRYAVRIKELEDEAKLGPVQRHIHSITTNVLTDACPRCKTAFYDFTGCFALHCSNSNCSCAFCGWCLEDCGSNAHNHVASCKHKLSTQHYDGTKVPAGSRETR